MSTSSKVDEDVNADPVEDVVIEADAELTRLRPGDSRRPENRLPKVDGDGATAEIGDGWEGGAELVFGDG